MLISGLACSIEAVAFLMFLQSDLGAMHEQFPGGAAEGVGEIAQPREGQRLQAATDLPGCQVIRTSLRDIATLFGQAPALGRTIRVGSPAWLLP